MPILQCRVCNKTPGDAIRHFNSGAHKRAKYQAVLTANREEIMKMGWARAFGAAPTIRSLGIEVRSVPWSITPRVDPDAAIVKVPCAPKWAVIVARLHFEDPHGPQTVLVIPIKPVRNRGMVDLKTRKRWLRFLRDHEDERARVVMLYAMANEGKGTLPGELAVFKLLSEIQP